MGTTEIIARFMVDTSFDDIPKDAVRVAKELLLDCVGAMLGGPSTEPGRICINYARETGGTPEATVVGGGFRTSAQNAAFANGSLAHALELEAVGYWPGGNPLTVLPVALLMTDKLHRTGKDVIEAVVVGYEVQGKIGMNSMGAAHRGWGTLTLFGALGAAATTAKALQLDLQKSRVALSLGCSQAGGLYAQMGTMTHLIEAGFACRNGVTAGLLAQAGITSNPDILETTRGFAEVVVGEEVDLEKMRSNLGNPFYITSPGAFVKKYPFCFSSHRAIDAILAMVREHSIAYDDVKEVEAGVNLFRAQNLRYPDPKTGDEARFSLQQCLGAAIMNRQVGLQDVTDAAAVDPRYRAARQKVRVVYHEEWPKGREYTSVPVTVRMTDGREYTRDVDAPSGGVNSPLTEEEQIARYRDLAGVTLTREQMDRVAELIMNLENVDDLTELYTLMGTRSKALDA